LLTFAKPLAQENVHALLESITLSNGQLEPLRHSRSWVRLLDHSQQRKLAGSVLPCGQEVVLVVALAFRVVVNEVPVNNAGFRLLWINM
jgi:hypothetical protein